MAKLDITYQKLIDLGFKRFDYDDPFFFAEHGYQPFALTFKLAKAYQIEIDSDRDKAILYRASKRPYSENYESYMQLNNLEEIRFTLAVFGHLDKAHQLDMSPVDSQNYGKEVDNG
ncbi:hypothetical protein [Algoriphagus formosus]|uniref:hypothetical protein n=1 Tax=Algoriphagus formosus TaxID=2007308 RepID=UPI003F6FF2DF